MIYYICDMIFKIHILNKTIMIQPRTQSIILHLDNLEALKCLSATSMGNLMFALMNYAACGEMPQFKNRALMAVFHLLPCSLISKTRMKGK